MSCEASADATGPLELQCPWAPLGTEAVLGEGEPYVKQLDLRRKLSANSQGESTSVLEGGGGLALLWALCLGVAGRLLETQVSGLRGDKFIFGGEDW